MENKARHIGDGVYAGFDGYHITLRVNDHRSGIVVTLEPSVMDAIFEYRESLKKDV